ncbi:IclR family transcriptional regulator [Microbacterium sp. G2-8]|uniref:IclR family transcriptional regulator n=1 Tax=Microbacterium sp. G2-8 TaxID=2842454 RepID=UPI001C8A7BE3|nr:IclR family transcriptional regulator [Microbacterium sp. G2-8]
MANSTSGESVSERIVRVLEAFDVDRTALTTTEIGRRARLPSSTAHRLVGELIQTGLLERTAGGRVQLGLHLWEIAQRGSRALRLRQIALPYMERVQARLGEHTQLGVLERDEVLFLERLSHPQAVSNVTRVAGRLPLHASSSGLVLLAFGDEELQRRTLEAPLASYTPDTVTDPDALRALLARIRREGFVVAEGFVEPVSRGIAVPIRDARDRVIAALSVVVPRADPSAGPLEEVRAAGAAISRRVREGADPFASR